MRATRTTKSEREGALNTAHDVLKKNSQFCHAPFFRIRTGFGGKISTKKVEMYIRTIFNDEKRSVFIKIKVHVFFWERDDFFDLKI